MVITVAEKFEEWKKKPTTTTSRIVRFRMFYCFDAISNIHRQRKYTKWRRWKWKTHSTSQPASQRSDRKPYIGFQTLYAIRIRFWMGETYINRIRIDSLVAVNHICMRLVGWLTVSSYFPIGCHLNYLNWFKTKHQSKMKCRVDLVDRRARFKLNLITWNCILFLKLLFTLSTESKCAQISAVYQLLL